jgi:hypothetical protein
MAEQTNIYRQRREELERRKKGRMAPDPDAAVRAVRPPESGFDQFKRRFQSGEFDKPQGAMDSMAGQIKSGLADGSALQAADDTARMLANAMTLGYADKLAGYMSGTGTAAERARTQQARDRAGSAAIANDVVGMMLPASGLAKGASLAGLAGKTLAGRTASMGAQGAMLGTGQALGNDQDVAMGAAIGGAAGVGGNLLGEGLSAGASKIAGLFNKRPKVNADDLKSVAQQAFREADDAGVIYRPEALARLRDELYREMAGKGFHGKLQPGAATAYDELSRLIDGGNVNLTGLKTLRELASGGWIAGNNKNNDMIRNIVSRIDDFAMSAGPDDVLTGNSQAAQQALAKGRDYWSRFRKLEKVDRLLDKAQTRAGSTGSGGNVENATRQNLRKILDSDKMQRGFKPDEKRALRAAVMGTPVQNTLRLLGKLSPQGNGLMAGLGVGSAMMKPEIAIPIMATAAASKKAAEAMTGAHAQTVRKIIAAGGTRAAMEGPKNAFQRLTETKREALARALMLSILGTAGKN